MNLKQLLQLNLVLGISLSCGGALGQEQRQELDLQKIKTQQNAITTQVNEAYRVSSTTNRLGSICGKIALGAGILGGLSLGCMPFSFDKVFVKGRTVIDNPSLMFFACLFNTRDHHESVASKATLFLWNGFLKLGTLAIGSYALKMACSWWADKKKAEEKDALKTNTQLQTNIDSLNQTLTDGANAQKTRSINDTKQKSWLLSKSEEADTLNARLASITSLPKINYESALTYHLGQEDRTIFKAPAMIKYAKEVDQSLQ